MSVHQEFVARAVTYGLVIALVAVMTAAAAHETGPLPDRAPRSAGRASLQAPSCPLSTAQQIKSNKAWLAMMPVFRHPRCLNCHGAIPNPFKQPVGARHSGVMDIDGNENGATCEECHVTDWQVAAGAPNWTDESDMGLCRGMHMAFDKDAPRFIDHLLRDGGGFPFVKFAFEGKRGLVDGGITIYEAETNRKFIPEPPPGTHAQFVQQARDWVAAQGGLFVGDESCGCEKPQSGEEYLLEIQLYDDRGFSGFVVTDSVAMKIRIDDTTVTVFGITNFPSIGIPQSLTSPQATVRWIPDPVGRVNIVRAIGSIAFDYPSPNTRELKIDFTHADTRAPLFERILQRNVRQRIGGEAVAGLPLGVQFDLVPGQKAYTTGMAKVLVAKLTQLFPVK